MITVDEFQFISQGADANARATSLLLQLHSIGPRLVFCANFSMAHKLWKRRKEDKDRLLVEHLTLEPWTKPCESLVAYLNELKRLAPKIFTFDANAEQEPILQYTFGVRRNIVVLVKWAYVASRRKGKSGTVGHVELHDAYLSTEYSVIREDVVLLNRQAIEKRMHRSDLWSPWEDEKRKGAALKSGADDTATRSSSNVSAASAAIKQFEARVDDALINAALTPDEAAALKVIDPTPQIPRPAAKVIRFARGPTAKEDLLAGADALDALE